MNFVIERIGRENEEQEEEIIDNFSYEFFDEEKPNQENNKKKNANLIQNKEKTKEKNNKTKPKKEVKKVHNSIHDIDNDMIIDFDEENLDMKESNKINYSLDQDDIIEIIHLNKDNDNNIFFEENNLEKKLFDKLNAKILLKDLYESKKKAKNAYEEYSIKLKEMMKNDSVKKIIENSSKKKSKNKINNDFLIHQQTNTINDINIFCLNNKDNNNNFINFNKQNNEIFDEKVLKKNKSQKYFHSNNNINTKPKINIINFEYNKQPDNNNKKVKEFLNEYNNSLLNRVFVDLKKNPNLNYEKYIDILNDLNYIDITVSPQIYFVNNSVYKHIWDFLVLIQSKNGINNNNDNSYLESNTLLIFLLILNGCFNSVKKLIEIKAELSWLKIDNYEVLIINDKYIHKNFGSLNEIREKNKMNLIEDNDEYNHIGNNIYSNIDNNINILEKKIQSVEISKFQDDIISDYFNSYASNTNEITNHMKGISNKKIRNHSEAKINRQRKIINNENKDNKKNKQLYAFKPKIKNITFNADKINLKKKKSSSKKKQINKSSVNSSINNFELKKILNQSGSKSKNKSKINYIEFANLSQNDISNKNNKSYINYDKININKRYENSNSKTKTRNYYNKIKQNRTDLLKLFKNSKYKEGTINENYEEIKRQRESNSKSKGKVKIKYENVVNIEKIENDKNNEKKQKHKYQFKKKEDS